MANTDKNIVITPNNGSASDPNIVFSGANATTGAQNITLTVTPNNSGTVAFSGSAGQLLAINNDISNTLSTGGTISATGNITANNFVGNLVGNVTGNFSGSLANGNSNVNIPAANGNVNISSAGNANVVVVTGTGANIAGTLSVSGNANIGNIGTDIITATGNITGGNLIGIFANGNSNISIPAANGNINISAGGTPNEIVITSTGVNIAGTLNISGNTIGANIQALTFKTSGTVISPAFLQGATVNAAAGTAYGFLSRGTLAAQANGDALFGYDVSLGTANTGTTGLTGLTFYAGRFDGSSWSNSGNGTINNAYGVYASAPTIGTNNYAIFASGAVSVTGNLTAANLITGGVISSTGNITAGNLIGIFANGNSNVSIPAANGNINFSVGGQANEVVFTSTGANVNGYLSVSGNANVGNIGATNGVFTNVSGNGSSLTSITGANVTGQVANALVSGTVYTAAQPNITSVGTLSSLSVSGTATLAAVNGTDASFSGNATVNGNLFVNGNLTYLNVETVAVEDPIIQLQTGANGAAPIANSGKDVGTALNYYDTAAKIAFMGWDVSNAEIAFGSNVSITNEVVTFTSLANTRSGNTLTTGVFATTLSATGNITAGNLIGIFANGNSSISIPAANGNINISAGGSPNEIVITSTGINVAGTLSVSGNANVGNLGTTGVFATTLSATGNANVGNLGVSGLISATGALTASSYTASNSLAGYTLANTGNTVGKVYENGNIIKLEATPATYGVALAANGTVQLSFDANGYGAIGASAGTTGYALRIAKQTTGAATAGSILINPTVQTDVTSLATGVRVSLSTAVGASPYTITNLVGSGVYGGTIGANTTVTNQIAYYVDATATGGTNNWGFYGGLASAASNFNLYMQGTANNYMAGSLGIGSTSLSAINMRVSKSLTGGTTAFNFVSDGTIGSDVTTNAVLNRVVGQTQAATFTLTNLIYNQAVQGTFGLNSTVTTQSGFTADNTLTGATNNYGFRGSIASGANRFNLYMDGTANNYSAGNFGIGTTSPAVALHVKQNAGSINVEGTDQAYIQFYPRTVANIRTAYVGIGSAGSNNFTIRNDDNGRLLLESGNSNVSVFANGNVTTTVAGTANVVVVTGTGANVTGTLNVTGNTTFSGVGQRILGDFSNNSPVSSRTAFQDKTTNNGTSVPIIPNGTNANAAIVVFNSSNTANASYGSIAIDNNVFQLGTSNVGTSPYVPLTVSVGGSERARVDTGGNLLVGTTNANGANNITTSIIGGIHQTIKGQVTAASGVATTLFTMPSQSFSTWMVTVQLAAADTANYSAWAMIATQTGSVRIMTNVAGTLLTISNSGLAIQATQSSGASSTIYYSAIRIM